MSSRVESFPLGLRELLGRGFPAQPLLFHEESLLPTVNVEKYLLLNARRTVQTLANPTIPGGWGQTTVPSGEFWFIHIAQFGVNGVLDADQAVRFSVSLQVNGIFFDRERIEVAALQSGASNLEYHNGPLIMRPGDVIQGNVDTITVGAAGSVDMFTEVLYSQLAP